MFCMFVCPSYGRHSKISPTFQKYIYTLCQSSYVLTTFWTHAPFQHSIIVMTANAVATTVLGSIPASSDTLESEGGPDEAVLSIVNKKKKSRKNPPLKKILWPLCTVYTYTSLFIILSVSLFSFANSMEVFFYWAKSFNITSSSPVWLNSPEKHWPVSWWKE